MNIANLKNKIKNLPDFSDKNYTIASYVIGGLITLSGLFLIYEVLIDGDVSFSAQWNIFKSPLGSICIFIGFIWAMLWWGKFTHWSATPVIETRDRSGNLLKREENYDVSEQMFAKFLMPILGHFVIEPIMYGAIIYYPLQCIIALIGAIFPYILTLLILAIIGLCWLYAPKLQFRARSWALVLIGLIFTVAFAWGGYAIRNTTPGSTIQMLVDTQQTTQNQSGNESTTIENVNNNETVEEPVPAEENAEEMDEQFEGVGEEGLLGSLPEGTTHFEGDMAGFPIEFAITKNDNSGDVKAIYKNVKYGTTMNLDGESLPAMGGDITFYGSEGGHNWTFELTGVASNVSGTARSDDGKEMKVKLTKKQ